MVKENRQFFHTKIIIPRSFGFTLRNQGIKLFFFQHPVRSYDPFLNASSQFFEDCGRCVFLLLQQFHGQGFVGIADETVLVVINKIIDFHMKAYGWQINVERSFIITKAEKSGALLRTKLRTAIELLDQLYQYGEVRDIHTEELMNESFDEEDIPDLIGEIMENSTKTNVCPTPEDPTDQ